MQIEMCSGGLSDSKTPLGNLLMLPPPNELAGAQSRGVSRSPETNLLLALVPDDDPFVSAESVGYTGLLPALFQFSTSAEQQPPHDSDSTPLQTGSGTAHGNATHSFRFSHTMQMNIPQPWDTINMSVILR